MSPREIQEFLEMLHARLNAIQKAIQENKTSIDSASKCQQEAWSRIPREIGTEVRSSDGYERGAKTYKHKGYWQQVFLNAITLCAFGAAAIYAAIAALQLCTMNKTYKEIRSQTILSERPWIAVSKVTVRSLQYEGNDPRKPEFTLVYTLENVGYSAARVEVYGRIIDQSVEDWHGEPEKACAVLKSRIDNRKTQPKWEPWTVIPKFPMPFALAYDGKPDPSDNRSDHPARLIATTNPVSPLNVGCVVYTSAAFDDIQHQSPFVVTLSMAKDTHGTAASDGYSIPISFDGKNMEGSQLVGVSVLATDTSD